MRQDRPMVVECRTCPVRGMRCEDCVMTAMAGFPPLELASPDLALDAAERRAVDVLVAAGLLDRAQVGALRTRREPFGEARFTG